jgi:multiple antibiotic resistance protein
VLPKVIDILRARPEESAAAMSSLVSFCLLCFGSLFSIVDPIAVVPVFVALTGQQPLAQQSNTALRASIVCFAVLSAFGLAGHFIFSFYGFTMGAFKIAGGLLVFNVAFDMLKARQSKTKQTDEERTEAASKADVGLMPLGLPLLSGPGAIATVMVFGAKAKGTPQKIGVYAAIFAVSVLTFFILRSSVWVARLLGTTGMNVVVRIMGLILAAVGMQFVIDGALEALPGLGRAVH